jgi:hypothetical protein
VGVLGFAGVATGGEPDLAGAAPLPCSLWLGGPAGQRGIFPCAPDWAVVGRVGLLGRPSWRLELGSVLFILVDLCSNFRNSYIEF